MRIIREIKYHSSVDNTMQLAISYQAETETPAPLLVGLHTWGGDYTQNCESYARWCIQNGWNFIHPHFRGPNRTPQAMGSELAVQDIVDAVKYARENGKIDEQRIYLIGGSGGGYAALLMAGRHPEIWAGVSAWCPISDIKAWYAECKSRQSEYAEDIEKSCGGNPAIDRNAECEAVKRSACTYLSKARTVNLDINAGIHDGHTGSVPVSHSLLAFNLAAMPEDAISRADIDYIVNNRAIPERFGIPAEDPLYGKNKVLFRKTSGNARITIFEGGHDLIPVSGLAWLESQRKDELPVWNINGVHILNSAQKCSKIHG